VELDGLPAADVAPVALAARVVPADVGQHQHAQQAVPVVRVFQHVGDEAVLAAGEAEQVGE
jgi:hypothetical protein